MNTELEQYVPAVLADLIIDFAKENPAKDMFVKELDYIRDEWVKHVIESQHSINIDWSNVRENDQLYTPSLCWQILNDWD